MGEGVTSRQSTDRPSHACCSAGTCPCPPLIRLATRISLRMRWARSRVSRVLPSRRAMLAITASRRLAAALPDLSMVAASGSSPSSRSNSSLSSSSSSLVKVLASPSRYKDPCWMPRGTVGMDSGSGSGPRYMGIYRLMSLAAYRLAPSSIAVGSGSGSGSGSGTGACTGAVGTAVGAPSSRVAAFRMARRAVCTGSSDVANGVSAVGVSADINLSI